MVDFDTQSLAVEIVQDVEQPDAATVTELVVHEVHCPALVDRFRNRQRLWLLAHDASFRLDSQVQLQLAVDPGDPLVVPGLVLDVAQVQV